MKLDLREIPDTKVFYTSDSHYNHKNICRGVSSWKDADDKTRDFQTLEKMNDAIVNGINGVVGQNDYLFHLGDWSFGGYEQIQKFRERIICKNIVLIFGNHDQHIKKNRDGCKSLFTETHSYLELIITNEKGNSEFLILSHYPICSWHNMNKGSIHLFGHVHLPPHKKIMKGRSMDVGMDGSNFIPYDFDEIMYMLGNRPKVGNWNNIEDHHEKVVR